nr:unnamed protein product [Spirometra erinaceieuropaei]
MMLIPSLQGHLEAAIDQPKDLGRPRTKLTALKKSCEEWNSHLPGQPNRRCQGRKRSTHVSVPPDPQRQPPTPPNMSALTKNILRTARSRQSSPDSVHQPDNPTAVTPTAPDPTPTASTTTIALTADTQPPCIPVTVDHRHLRHSCHNLRDDADDDDGSGGGLGGGGGH